MSLVDNGNVVDIKAIRNRLWNPPNGRPSSELDITLSARAKRQQFSLKEQQRKAKEDFERRLKLQAMVEEALKERNRAKAKRMQEIADALAALEDISTRPPSLRKIIEVTGEYYGVSYNEMMSRRSNQQISNARQVAMYLCKVMTSKSLPQIGREFNGRDHTTIMYGARRTKKLVETRPHIAAEIDELKKKIEAA